MSEISTLIRGEQRSLWARPPQGDACCLSTKSVATLLLRSKVTKTLCNLTRSQVLGIRTPLGGGQKHYYSADLRDDVE